MIGCTMLLVDVVISGIIFVTAVEQLVLAKLVSAVARYEEIFECCTTVASYQNCESCTVVQQLCINSGEKRCLVRCMYTLVMVTSLRMIVTIIIIVMQSLLVRNGCSPN